MNDTDRELALKQQELHGTARSRVNSNTIPQEHEHAARAFIKEQDAPRRYSQIEDYGAIGNLRTAALISKQGSIDWFCFPHFDSPSIFGALLDAVKGGYFRIAPRNLDACRLQQMYMPDTNVLVSRFLSEEGVSQVTDFMPLSSRQEDIHPWLLREVVCVRGTTQVEVECFPAFEYGTAAHSFSIVEPVGLEEYEAQLLRAQEQHRAVYPGEMRYAGAKPGIGVMPSRGHQLQQGSNKASSIPPRDDIVSDDIVPSISANTSDSTPTSTSEPVLLSDPKSARRMRFTNGSHVSPTARFVGPNRHFDLSLIVRTGQDVPAYDTRARVQVAVAEEPEGDNEISQPQSQGTPKDAQVSSSAVDESDNLIEYQVIQRPSMRGLGVRVIVRLKESQTLYVSTRFGCGGVNPLPAITHDYFADLLTRTQLYWHEWTSKCRYRGRWRESVLRSALVLKLMTFAPTGGIVAALSTSLPEGLGLARNWDYRFTWVRDAAFTVYAFLRIGFLEEAEAYMKWIELRCREMQQTGHLQIMYGVDGRHELTEAILDHWEGYKGSGPVRIGNHAYQQTQNDIYGELLNSVSLSDSSGAPISFDFWMHLRKLLNYVCAHWQDSDFGIWEVRGGQQHFIYSKIMCWVALDRGITLAQNRKFPSEALKWAEVRDQIYEEVMTKGYSCTLQAFKQSYAKDSLDAANLMLPLVMFVSPNDPRMLSTIDAMLRSPEQGGLVANNLCFRYNVRTTDDGLTGEEGTFSICSFWLVEALARAGQFDRRRLEHARLIFEQMLSYGNHLGLFSEQIGKTGEQLGNFPQAFTHLALISSALYLDNLLG